MSKFRVNSLMAIKQGHKVRPVLNVSLPKLASLNDNVNKLAVEKVKMSTAKKFSYSVIEAGKNCLITKFDMVDAYKNVPAKTSDLRLQGFSWLDKYFVELRLIFGATTAVTNYDVLSNTVATLAKAECDIAAHLLHRILDDVPFVAPGSSAMAYKFSNCYARICRESGIQLAPDCPDFDKAFKHSTYGKVLGVFFNTKDLCWSLPQSKSEKALGAIRHALSAVSLSVKEFQSLTGRLNDIAQMSQFLKGFTHPINKCLSHDAAEADHSVELSAQARKDLLVWARFLLDRNPWSPICHRPASPPLGCKSFTTDAAGCAEGFKLKGKVGCGCVGFSYDGVIIFASQLFWPCEVLEGFRDSSGSLMGCKTTTLEFLGILMPFLLAPETLVNQHVIVKVDITGCFFGWQNKHTPGDETASILIRALHLISSYLGCVVHVEHLPRIFSWDDALADRLSRELSTTRQDLRLLNSFSMKDPPVCLLSWMENPEEDWLLADRLLQNVISVCNLC